MTSSPGDPLIVSAWDLAPGDRFDWAGLAATVIATAPDVRDERIMVVTIDCPAPGKVIDVRYGRTERIRKHRR